MRSRGLREAAAAELFAATTAAIETGGDASQQQPAVDGQAGAAAQGAAGPGSQPAAPDAAAGVKVKVSRGRRVLADDDEDEEDGPAPVAAVPKRQPRAGGWDDETDAWEEESDPEDFSTAPARGGRLRKGGAAAQAADGDLEDGGGGGALQVSLLTAAASGLGGGGGVFVGEEEALLDADVALAAPEKEVLAFEVQASQVRAAWAGGWDRGLGLRGGGVRCGRHDGRQVLASPPPLTMSCLLASGPLSVHCASPWTPVGDQHHRVHTCLATTPPTPCHAGGGGEARVPATP